MLNIDTANNSDERINGIFLISINFISSSFIIIKIK